MLSFKDTSKSEVIKYSDMKEVKKERNRAKEAKCL
jgi:hypothetical protein